MRFESVGSPIAFDGRNDIGTELAIPIEDQESMRLFAIFPSFVQLQCNPKAFGLRVTL